MAGSTSFAQINKPEGADVFRLVRDTGLAYDKIDMYLSQGHAATAEALLAAAEADTKAGRAISRANAIEDPIYVGTEKPAPGTKKLWINPLGTAPAPVKLVPHESIEGLYQIKVNVPAPPPEPTPEPEPEPEPEPDPTNGIGYVGQIADASPYTTLELVTADDSGDVVSLDLVSLGSRTRTVRVQGEFVEGTGYIDGYQRIEEITGNDGARLLGPRSNLEWAMQYFATTSATSGSQFSPYHGSTTALAWQTGPPTYETLAGAAVSVPSTPGQTVSLPDGFAITQTVRAQHPDAPDEDQIEVTTVTSFHPDGMIEVTGELRFLVDTKVNVVYAPMVPFTQADIDTLTHEGGVETLPSSPPSGTTNLTLPDIDGGLLEGSGVQIAWHWVDPDTTLRRGEADRKTTGDITFIQRRTDGIDKVYHHVWASDTVVAAGTTHSFGAQWRYQEVA